MYLVLRYSAIWKSTTLQLDHCLLETCILLAEVRDHELYLPRINLLVIQVKVMSVGFFIKTSFFYKIRANPGLFFVYFHLFKQTLQFFTTNKWEKYPSSIWCWDSNPRPLENESPPITAGPGLPPYKTSWRTNQRHSLTLTNIIFSLQNNKAGSSLSKNTFIRSLWFIVSTFTSDDLGK